MIFFKWLKQKLNQQNSVSIRVDEKIKLLARKKLQSQETMSEIGFWNLNKVLLSGTAFALCFLFFINLPLNDSFVGENNPELTYQKDLILQHDDIEIMSESSEWSDADWEIALAEIPSEKT